MLCPKRGAGYRLILMLTIPVIALLMIVPSGILAYRVFLEQSRLDAVCETSTNQQLAGSHQAQDKHVPPLNLLFANLGLLLYAINFAIILPGSEATMIKAGGTTFHSGLVIGSYALGSIISLPLMLHFSRHSYRSASVFMSVVSVLGNLAFGIAGSTHNSAALYILILARVFCGLEGGINVVFSNMVLRMSSGAGTVEAMSVLTLMASLGLAVGPGLASLSSLCFPHATPELPPAMLMTLCFGLYGLFTCHFFPDQNACMLLEDVPPSVFDNIPKDNVEYSSLQLRTSWLSLGVGSILSAGRGFQRVCWEAGALLVLEKQFGMTTKTAGSLVMMPLLACVLVAKFVGPWVGLLGPVRFIRVVSAFEFVGMALMFYMPIGPTLALIIFLCGSSIFYASNYVVFIPCYTLRAKFALQSHSVLNLEMSTVVHCVVGFVGMFYGPVVSRAVLGACLHQNLLAIIHLIAWFGLTVVIEIAIPLLFNENSNVGEQR